MDAALQDAIAEAHQRGHEHLHAEHLLSALLTNTNCQDLLRRCGTDIETLQGLVDEYLSQFVEAPPQT